MKILVVFGTRPEAIKMALVVKKLQRCEDAELKVCVTAQHRHMLDQVLDLFQIQPNYDLNLMKDGQDLTDITCKVLSGLRGVFKDFKPDRVVVHGDTTTSFTTSLASYYHHVSVAHVEAGLRTGNIYAPWPEEINRKLIGSITDIHFAPTISARDNLLHEGVKEEQIYVTGNTVVDVLLDVKQKIESDHQMRKKLETSFPFLSNQSDETRIILVTGHRRESFGSGFERICQALLQIARSDLQLKIVYPVHLNSNVREPVQKYLSDQPNIFLIEPQDYLPFVYLMMRAYLILTDSGGIQEEAPSLGKPVLVMREMTERPEAVKAGTVQLVGTNVDKIVSYTTELLNNKYLYERMSTAHNPYGDGQASARICDILCPKQMNVSDNK